MKVEARTEHYWVDTISGCRFASRLDAEVYALTRELNIELNVVSQTQMKFMEEVARYICGNYALHSLKDEDLTEEQKQHIPAG